MSEIEKMYENAGIEQTQDTTCGDCEFVNYPEENKPCNACTQYGIKHHPPFTAEKQLNLMAFLINRKVGLSFKAEQGEITVEAISRGLAGIVNRIWQDLTEEEKTSIKNILEM